jgi:hypothetical protein
MAGSEKFDYGRYMEKAMRGVMAEVLGYVARHGLPGDHYFYITLDTTHPGVDIPDWLRARYPAEMMIVLQEWFDDLAVMGDRFRVTLNFSNRPETLVIPFASVKTFIDPAAKFGLKFDSQAREDMVLELDEATGDGAGEEQPGPDGDKPKGPGEVVSLDRFRKS